MSRETRTDNAMSFVGIRRGDRSDVATRHANYYGESIAERKTHPRRREHDGTNERAGISGQAKQAKRNPCIQPKISGDR